jgi:hypothetical protein
MKTYISRVRSVEAVPDVQFIPAIDEAALSIRDLSVGPIKCVSAPAKEIIRTLDTTRQRVFIHFSFSKKRTS